MAGLWRNSEGTREGKYLVKRRDGTIPEWAWFVMGSLDPAAPAGLRAYAAKAEEFGFDPQYVADIREMAEEWEQGLARLSVDKWGDPDAGRHRQDDPATVEQMKGHRGS